MDGIGKSELALAAVPHGGVLQSAAFPDSDFHFPDAPSFDADPYYGLPYDDDSAPCIRHRFRRIPSPRSCWRTVLSTGTFLTPALSTPELITALFAPVPPAPLLPGTRPVPLSRTVERGPGGAPGS